MNKVPLVSIDCITYNHAPFIRQCLDGFIMQKTNFDFEVLIHDDASTDETQEIIREYELKYPNIIKPIYQTENQWSKGIGISSTFNFPRAQGKYIALCEGDDCWTDPYKLQKQIDILESDDKISFVYTNFQTVDENGNIIKRPAFEKYIEQSKSGDIFNLLLKGNFVLTLTTCFRKEILISREIDLSPHKLDYLYFLIAACKGNAIFLSEKTGNYRMNSNSLVNTQSTKVNIQLQEIFEYIALLYAKGVLSRKSIRQDYITKKIIINKAVNQYRKNHTSFLKEILRANCVFILYLVLELFARGYYKMKLIVTNTKCI